MQLPPPPQSACALTYSVPSCRPPAQVLAESDADVAEQMLPKIFGLLTVGADPGLRTAAVRVLSSASSHTGDIGRRLAEQVLVNGAVSSLWSVAKDAQQLKLRELLSETFTCLANIARHSEETAVQCVTDPAQLQIVRMALTDENRYLRTTSAAFVYQLSRQGSGKGGVLPRRRDRPWS